MFLSKKLILFIAFCFFKSIIDLLNFIKFRLDKSAIIKYSRWNRDEIRTLIRWQLKDQSDFIHYLSRFSLFYHSEIYWVLKLIDLLFLSSVKALITDWIWLYCDSIAFCWKNLRNLTKVSNFKTSHNFMPVLRENYLLVFCIYLFDSFEHTIKIWGRSCATTQLD